MAIVRTALQEVGGWRIPRETGYLDPEADLLARVNDVAGPPVWIPRPTCVKLSASLRRDVYWTRPHFEQEHWLRTIRDSPDPEAAILETVGQPYVLAQLPPPARFHTRAWRLMRSWLPKRLKRYRLRERFGRQPRSAKHIRRNRRFKGL
jgi:hypothetical protein